MAAPMANAAQAGFVSLVGAGPGDPELLTLRALHRLESADCVLYDALVSDAVLALSKRARRLCVGKRAGRHAVRQEAIHRLMIRLARRGARVVRLKGGDPFVLGRGGEEALALCRADVPFEIVPGLSSALAAPALAEIPVTHRGLSSALLILSAHDIPAFEDTVRRLAPSNVTLVVLMGLGRRKEIANSLLARGWHSHTPAAVLTDASTPHAARHLTSLAKLADHAVGESSCGTLVIGRVVSVAVELDELRTLAHSLRGAA
jgi:uroporphyrin-III C-methyltransferase/precorrin-2 dehydrogenase/sirohydrochlorin ferrochelatase